MNIYRINKYSGMPEDEWLAISDVGKMFGESVLTTDKYLRIENAFCDLSDMIMNDFPDKYITIKKLEKSNLIEMFFNITKNDENFNCNESTKLLYSLNDKDVFVLRSIKDNIQISSEYLSSIVKLALREYFWCEVHWNKSNNIIVFGYDYNMYIKCQQISSRIYERAKTNNISIDIDNSCLYFDDEE